MGTEPKTSKLQTHKRPSIVSYEEAKRASRKEFNIARGALREGALYNPEEEIAPEPDEQPKKSRIALVAEAKRAAREERKRQRTKAKADKRFDKAYGAEGSSDGGRKGLFGKGSVQPENAPGPRPAVYKGKMGSSHKKSSQMQAKGKTGTLGIDFSLPRFSLPHLPRKLGLTLKVLGVTVVCAIALYGPAQQYYQQMRETDRLQAEYSAVAARSAALQSSIDSLQTDEGIYDKAHTDLGYVRANEHTATVKGVTFDDSKEFASNVVPGSIPAPETWYSPFFDVFFGYDS